MHTNMEISRYPMQNLEFFSGYVSNITAVFLWYTGSNPLPADNMHYCLLQPVNVRVLTETELNNPVNYIQ